MRDFNGKTGKILASSKLSIILFVLIVALTFFEIRQTRNAFSESNSRSSPQILHQEPLAPILSEAAEGTRIDNPSEAKYVVYNRVAKCGSSSTRLVLAGLSENNHRFTEWFHYEKNDSKIIEKNEEKRLIKKFSDFQVENPYKAFVYTRHFYYFDFPKSLNLTFINLVRHPVDRFVSKFYYRQVGFTHDKSKNATNLLSINKCLQEADDHPDKYFRIVCKNGGDWSYVPYFCGRDPVCLKPTREALEKAIHNIRKHYLIVGTLENYTQFLELAEILIPRIFEGAADFNKASKWIRNYSKTTYKEAISDEMREHLMSTNKMKLEIELYNFIKKRFRSQLYEYRLL